MPLADDDDRDEDHANVPVLAVIVAAMRHWHALEGQIVPQLLEQLHKVLQWGKAAEGVLLSAGALPREPLTLIDGLAFEGRRQRLGERQQMSARPLAQHDCGPLGSVRMLRCTQNNLVLFVDGV
jgi:hypothetical protein